MKLKAVVFDLFGTLVDDFSIREHERLLSKMAKVLSAPRDAFAQMWVETFPQRATGLFPTIEANIKHVCQVLGCHVTDTQIKKASAMRLNFVRQKLTPRPGVLDILAQLRFKTYKIGLITNCSPELPKLWPTTPLANLVDVAVFSCLEGVKKPDPKIYMVACQRLGVAPRNCLYIGNGSSHELTGAAAVGMRPLLLRVPYETYDTYRIEVDEWQGPSISDLKEILTILKIN
jgi:putative hydrolase of the HAD superfamily